MSYLSEEEMKTFLGKQLNDQYGRILGRVVGLRISDYGQLEGLEVEKGNGNLAKYPIDLVTLDGDKIFLVADWKVTTETISKELDRIVRRDRALGELLQEHQIPPNIYEELKRKQEQSLDELHRQKEELIRNLEGRIVGLDKQVDELIRFLVNVKMEYRAGLIDDTALSVACDAIEPNMKPILDEKKDVRKAIETVNAEALPSDQQAPTSKQIAMEQTPPQSKDTSLKEKEEPADDSSNGPISIQLEG